MDFTDPKMKLNFFTVILSQDRNKMNGLLGENLKESRNIRLELPAGYIIALLVHYSFII